MVTRHIEAQKGFYFGSQFWSDPAFREKLLPVARRQVGKFVE
jgi:hypothetical protein